MAKLQNGKGTEQKKRKETENERMKERKTGQNMNRIVNINSNGIMIGKLLDEVEQVTSGSVLGIVY